MNNPIVKIQLPEERELDKKLAELETLENQLAGLELEKVTLQVSLRTFERHYIQTVGRLYAEMDRIEAEIAEWKSFANPTNENLQQQAQKARKTAQETAGESKFYSSQTAKEVFQPSDKLKKLYREIVKRVHPDLASSEEDRNRRHQLMVEVNNAYEDGDENGLLAILDEWNENAEIQSTDIGAKLVRAIRKIAQVTGHLENVTAEIDRLKQLDLYALFTKCEAAKLQRRNLLTEMAADAESQLVERRQNLADLKIAKEKL